MKKRSHHHARIVEPVPFIFDSPAKYRGAKSSLPINTPIKRVKLSGGVYTFEALFGREWHHVQTDADLPAFTDKGRAHRAEQSKRARASELRVGRPPKSNGPSTTTLTIRVTHEQKRQLGKGYGPKVIAALVAAGLVSP